MDSVLVTFPAVDNTQYQYAITDQTVYHPPDTNPKGVQTLELSFQGLVLARVGCKVSVDGIENALHRTSIKVL